MCTKDFENYVWEEELVILTLPYFSLGKHIYTFVIDLIIVKP